MMAQGMAGESESVCKCEGDSEPICGFCADDLYCPQCGDQITSVFSDDGVVDDKAGDNHQHIVYVYPDRQNHEFIVTLSSLCRDRDRDNRRGAPQLDVARSFLEVPDWFDRRIEELGPREDQSAMRYRLKPRPTLTGPNWHINLPPRGVHAYLNAVGAFRPHRFELYLCRRPEFIFTVVGDGVLPADDPDGRTWRVGERGQLPITLRMEVTSPVAFRGDVEMVSDDGAIVRPVVLPTRGRILRPDEVLTFEITIDSRRWETDSQHTLKLRMELASLVPFDEEIVFRAVAMGKLRFSCGPRLLCENMHLGNLVHGASQWGRLYVENEGEETVYIEPPQVEFETPTGLEGWLACTWTNTEEMGETRGLAPGERADLQLDIDLREIRHEQLPPGGELRAKIVLRSDLRDWTLPVRLPGVTPRRPTDAWLAIDYGSTNTYVSIWETRDVGTGPRVVPVLTRTDPERFASAIFFEDVQSAPLRYVVGPEAAAKGENWPTALVTGMKRWIGVRDVTGQPRQWHVHDPRGQEATFDVATLVRFLLLEVIRQCEDQLGARIRRIGVSFPANFEPSRIAALREILVGLQAEFRQMDPPRELLFAEPRLDEASAVALGFVLDSAVLLPIVAPNWRPDRRHFHIGSFDFGGGTIDTAVVRFELVAAKRELLKFASYQSEYLGVGGDENFGGENITLAFMELLVDRIQNLVSEALQESGKRPPALPIARAGAPHASVVARRNFEAIWSAAERIKLCACDLALHDDSDETRRAKSLDLLQESLVQQFNRLTGVDENEAERPLWTDDIIRRPLEQAIRDNQFLIPLEQVYNHTIRDDLRVTSKLTIRQRLQRCVDELFEFAARHKAELDFVVLAGAASRLPLVRRLFEERFAAGKTASAQSHHPQDLGPEFQQQPLVEEEPRPEGRIFFDRDHPKSKVAQGLARYLELVDRARSRIEGLTIPGDYTPGEIGLVEPATKEFVVVVPACTRCTRADTWFDIPIPVQYAWNGDDRRIELFLKRRGLISLWGVFDLGLPAPPTSSPDDPAGLPVERQLPADVPHEAVAQLRFRAGMNGAELRIVSEASYYGYWPLSVPQTSEFKS